MTQNGPCFVYCIMENFSFFSKVTMPKLYSPKSIVSSWRHFSSPKTREKDKYSFGSRNLCILFVCNKKYKMFEWKGNIRVFREWEDRETSDLTILRSALSLAQFGCIKEGKLVWIEARRNKRIPLVLPEDVDFQVLEKVILPQIYNNHVGDPYVLYFAKRVKIVDERSKSVSSSFVNKKNFHRTVKDGDVLNLRVVSDGNLIFCCFAGAKDKF
ncbi:hypothetical protein [Brazilian marseillevirus]|uniref:hypothetical protein n=1 Tax=Brazilian marseillevirus TaxID=1813599 RepID=UPI000780C61A|nr:hypothetical protein A3303_gp223 [Brazilian marseillevirus]AMQ10731.1 hypothetical protein [Brazilian marseillevirus]